MSDQQAESEEIVSETLDKRTFSVYLWDRETVRYGTEILGRDPLARDMIVGLQRLQQSQKTRSNKTKTRQANYPPLTCQPKLT